MRKTLLIVSLSMLLSQICFGQADPTVAAPTPTVNPANVISIFSGAYTDLVGTNFNPNWGQTTVVSQVLIAGNNTIKYTNLNYQGTEFTQQNLATMNNVHFDYWTDDAATLTFFLINKTTGGAGEKSTPITITKGSWQSVDIPLSTFTSQGFSVSDVFQFKIVGNGTVFLDNLYFSGGTTTADNDASLSDLRVDGTTITGFSADVLAYTIELARGTTVVPTITATSTQSAASFVITTVASIPGTSTVVVTAKDGTTKRTYSVAFTESINFPIDFEVGTYTFIGFDGGVGTVIPNPESSGINTSAKVAQIIRNVGATWAGAKIVLPYKLDFSTKSTFSMKVYSARAGVPVNLKLEGTGVPPVEVNTPTTVANQWEILTWDFTGKPSNAFDNLVFMFDLGAVGDGSANSTFLFDDIDLIDNSGGLTQIDLPVNFEGSTVNYALTDFGGNATVLGTDPANTGNSVAITTKTTGAETWAGTTIGTDLGFSTTIPFSANSTKISVRVYSPTAGIQVRLKAEDHANNTLTAETEATTTVANAWEQLTFDFSKVVAGTNPFNLSTRFDKVSIFFDFGISGNNKVYYWDDVTFVNTVGLHHPDAANMVVYPNPAENNLYFSSTTTLRKVAIYNVVGTQVKEYGNVLQSLNVSDLKTGVYVIRLTDVNGKITTSKFVKK